MSKRKNRPVEKNRLWMDTLNRCPICKSELTLPIENVSNLSKEHKKIYDSWNRQQQEINHIGIISHNVSHSKLNYSKYKELVQSESIRSRYEEHKSFDALIKKRGIDNNKEQNQESKYGNSSIESYWNKIILCHNCSQKIDGKKFKNQSDFKKFFKGLHLKSPNDQIQHIINLKEEVIENFKSKSNSISKKQINYYPIIQFRTNEEFQFLESSVRMIAKENEIDNIFFNINPNFFSRQNNDDVLEIISSIIKKRISNIKTFIENEEINDNIKKILAKNFLGLSQKRSNNYNVYIVQLKLNIVKNETTIYFDIFEENDLIIQRKFSTFINDLRSTSEYQNAINSKWISNNNLTKINWNEKQEYLSFKNLLIKQLAIIPLIKV